MTATTPLQRSWHCGHHALPLGHKTYVMGIINASPDSFSGDGIGYVEAAVGRALQLIDDGADLLDIGGESTRPGAAPVSEAEELRRVLPLVTRLAEQTAVPLSIDTTKAAVAAACLAAGASVVNDISGGLHDDAMLGVIAAGGCGCILMHRRGTPRTMAYSQPVAATGEGTGGDIIAEIKAYFSERIEATVSARIDPACLCLDAGFGFGKSYAENLLLLRRGAEFTSLGFPLMVGTSNKSTIGKALGGAEVGQRTWGTAATVALAIAAGCDVVRVHDVRSMRDVARMSDAVVRAT